MKIFHKEKNACEQCNQNFSDHEQLISHARHFHHYTILRCHECGKEFIHEKDRLHHSREEHKRKLDSRAHKDKAKHR